MTDSTSRLEMLRNTVVEDACNVRGFLDDAAIKVLAERTLAEAKGKRGKGVTPGGIALEGHVEQVESIRAAKEAATILALLSEKGVKTTELKTTFQVLLGALAKGFVHADNEKTKDRLAEVMRSVRTHGLEREWGDALRLSLDKYYESNALGKFVAESDEQSNKTAISKVLQRRASIAEIGGFGMSRLLFEARCGHALGRNENTLRLVGPSTIAHIKRMTQLAEWSFQLAGWVCHLEKTETVLTYPDTIEISGTLSRYGSSKNSQELVIENLVMNERRIREQWTKLDKPEESRCTVKLTADGNPRRIHLS